MGVGVGVGHLKNPVLMLDVIALSWFTMHGLWPSKRALVGGHNWDLSHYF